MGELDISKEAWDMMAMMVQGSHERLLQLAERQDVMQAHSSDLASGYITLDSRVSALEKRKGERDIFARGLFPLIVVSLTLNFASLGVTITTLFYVIQHVLGH